MQIDWNAVIALTGLVTAITAVVALWTTVRSSSTLMQIEMITHLEDRYTADEIVKVRAEAAKILLAPEKPKAPNSILDRLLIFYEFLGLLKRQKALSDFMIWHSFSTDIFYYTAAAKEYIFESHSWNRAVYADLIKLHETMVKIEKKEAGIHSPELNLSKEDIRVFLESEAKAFP